MVKGRGKRKVEETGKWAALTWSWRVGCLNDDVGNLKNLNKQTILHDFQKTQVTKALAHDHAA